MARVLDVEAESDRGPMPAQRMTRIRLLRNARATLGEWREGRITTAQAVAALEALANSLREE